MGRSLEREVGTLKTMVDWMKGSKDRETASDRLTTKKGKQNRVYRHTALILALMKAEAGRSL